MNRREHLITIAAEECAELAQELSKANRFGMKDGYPGKVETNAERIRSEFNDLVATLHLLEDETGEILTMLLESDMRSKQRRVEEFLVYSKTVGTLQ